MKWYRDELRNELNSIRSSFLQPAIPEWFSTHPAYHSAAMWGKKVKLSP
jgi:hypothetical protein